MEPEFVDGRGAFIWSYLVSSTERQETLGNSAKGLLAFELEAPFASVLILGVLERIHGQLICL